MKRKWICLLLSAIMLFSMIPFSAVAETVPPTTAIKGHNLALEDSVHVIYYVDAQNVPAGAEQGVLLWLEPQPNYLYGKETYKLTKTTGTYQTYLKYEFAEIAAKMMTTDIYAVSFVKVGDQTTYSALDKYSVLQYAYNKKGSATVLDGGTTTLGELLTQMLEYGAMAQKYFNYKTDRLANATYYSVNVENGTLSDGTTKGLYQAGDQITLTAQAGKDGMPFLYWVNGQSEKVSEETTINVNVKGIETYTAIYQSREKSDLDFELNADGESYSVTGIGEYKNSAVVIPSEYNGLPVTSIGQGAFSGNTKIESVVFSETVKEIGDNAFNGCSAIKNIEVPDNVETIGSSAFAECTGLRKVILSNSITVINAQTFYNCSKLAVVEMNKVKSIGKEAFRGCNMSYIEFPDSVESIGVNAFSWCQELKTVVIGKGLTSIRSGAFANCRYLASVTFANTKGWYITMAPGANSGTSMSVTDAAQNATLLGTTYINYNWYRK